MKRAPRSRQRHDLYAKYHDYDSEISDLLGECGITVRDLLLNRSDVHHVFPKNYLKGRGFTAARYNQVANFVIAQSEINIAIGDKAPDIYFSELADQCSGGPQRYGGIADIDEMRANLETNCVPGSVLNGSIPDYDDFLEERRKMMAEKIHLYFKSL